MYLVFQLDRPLAHRLVLPALAVACLMIGDIVIRASEPPAKLDYNRDVRPILSENCFSCHGADAAGRKAKLRLDNFSDASAARGRRQPAIIPGRPDDSELVRRIFDAGEEVMPPEDSHKVLTAVQKETLKRWVREGAEYQPHWAFVPPKRAEPPKVRNETWVRNPVDRFVLARLEQEKMKPAVEADRRTLARRLGLDLTGLPPDTQMVEDFVKDKSPAAYEKYVDALLASSRWGEHRARYWLDVARYADTHGIHFDNYREMWVYRDWVIGALNSNMPFDRFTVEQLAGDLLPEPSREQKIASGFNRNHATSNEGGLIDEEYLVLYARDRTETTSQAWLGLTAGCAVCHDHKYDPLTQKEFYSLAAFFNNTTQEARDLNIRDTPPVLVIPKPEDELRLAELTGLIPAAEERVRGRRAAAKAAFTNWLTDAPSGALTNQLPATGRVFYASLSEGTGSAISYQLSATNGAASLPTNTNWRRGAIAAKAYTLSGASPLALREVGDFERTNAFSFAAWVQLADDKAGALFGRMAVKGSQLAGWDLWLEGGRLAFDFIHQWPKQAIRVAAREALPKDRWNHVCVTYDGSSLAAGVRIYVNGELSAVEVKKDSLDQSARTKAPFKIGQRENGSEVKGAGLQDLNIFDRVLTTEEVKSLALLPRLNWLTTKGEVERTKEEDEEMYLLWLGLFDKDFPRLAKARQDLKAEEAEIQKRSTVAYVMQERTNAPEAYVLFRGEYDKRGDRVTPATPSFLPPMSADMPRDRLGFAKWLTQPENPLMARVTVNRFWQELFGVGLVKTAGDFGLAGEPPVNPELLDWLAVEFRESGWDVKRLFKLIVCSATYRQAATVTPEKLERDPENRWLSRGPRFRMDGEMIRDTALAASGLLVDKLGGPAVKPYQPPGIWDVVGLPQGNTREYQPATGEGLYRRSVYTFWKRQAPPPSMEIFNAPSREVCTVRRERTDTPLQALVTLNDPQFVEAARHLAQLALTQPKSDVAGRINFMAARILARPLTTREKRIVTSGLNDLLAHYRKVPGQAALLVAVGDSKADAKLDVPTLAAYTVVANQLLNLDEALNK